MQTVDNGSNYGVCNLWNPVVYNSMMNDMSDKEDIFTQGMFLYTEDRDKYGESL